MEYAFSGAELLTYKATDVPDLSRVTSMSHMFKSASKFNGDLSDWDVGAVTDMSGLFSGATSFDQDLNTWDVSRVSDMSFMFMNATSFDQDLNTWDVSGVRDMSYMFLGANSFNGDIGNWNVSDVTTMASMFSRATSFKRDLSQWDASGVTDMSNMFYGATLFNVDIGDWDVGNVTNMSGMFWGASAFDQDLGGWDVSNVSNMFRMFDDSGLSTDNYDATLIGWAALPTLQRSVTLSADGVNYCESGPARQSLADVYDWKIEGDAFSCVPDRYEVRVDNETPWGGQGVKVTAQLVSPGGTSIPEPGRTVRWSVTNGGLLTEVSTTTNDDGVATVTFIPATTAGVSHVVTATDGEDLTLTGEAPTITTQFAPFITIWNTDDAGAPPDNEITIPTIGGGYEYYVSWVEVGNPQNNGADGPFAGDATITFPRRGTYEVRISGDFPRIYIYWYDDHQKIRSIEQWGDIAWSSMEYAFSGAANLKYNATDTPDLTLVTDLRNMFSYAHSLNVDLRGWDVGNVTTMAGMFSNASTFNGDISDWDVSRVTDMSNMFESARAFNRDLSDWDVSNVTDMSRMFTNAHAFNQYLDWDVSSVTDMRGMFLGASSFNQDLGGWNVSNVRDMVDMFDVTALSSENYDATLAGWAALPTLQRDVSLGAADVSYCEGAAARRLLINEYNWEMIGDSFACEAAQYIVTVSDQLPERWPQQSLCNSEIDTATISRKPAFWCGLQRRSVS